MLTAKQCYDHVWSYRLHPFHIFSEIVFSPDFILSPNALRNFPSLEMLFAFNKLSLFTLVQPTAEYRADDAAIWPACLKLQAEVDVWLFYLVDADFWDPSHRLRSKIFQPIFFQTVKGLKQCLWLLSQWLPLMMQRAQLQWVNGASSSPARQCLHASGIVCSPHMPYFISSSFVQFNLIRVIPVGFFDDAWNLRVVFASIFFILLQLHRDLSGNGINRLPPFILFHNPHLSHVSVLTLLLSLMAQSGRW
jgi:hypothetical protein